MARNRLAALAAVLADDTRSELVLALMDGRARTGSELARHVGLARSTVSEHLGRLLDAGLITVEAQGRHRYVRLAGPDVAELIETLCGSAPAAAMAGPPAPADLVHIRTCYDHLAGWVAVAIHDELVAGRHLIAEGDGVGLSQSGCDLLATIGVDVDGVRSVRRPVARRCLDWTERRHHLGGAAGAALLTAMRANGWLRDGPRPRAIRITDAGRVALSAAFGVAG